MNRTDELHVTSGVARFEGIFSKWYAYASTADRQLEGPLRWLKLSARRDERALVAKLRRLPRTSDVPRFYS